MSKFDFVDFVDFSAEDSAGEFMRNYSAYAFLKSTELENIPENELVKAVTAWIESKFNDDWTDMCAVINKLPTPCLNVYCAAFAVGEILNGGFAQLFFNTSRDFIGAAASGLEAIGCIKAAEIVSDALKIHYDGKFTKSGSDFNAFVEFCSENHFDSLDKQFSDCFDNDRFNTLAGDYILKNKKYFGSNE